MSMPFAAAECTKLALDSTELGIREDGMEGEDSGASVVIEFALGAVLLLLAGSLESAGVGEAGGVLGFLHLLQCIF